MTLREVCKPHSKISSSTFLRILHAPTDLGWLAEFNISHATSYTLDCSKLFSPDGYLDFSVVWKGDYYIARDITTLIPCTIHTPKGNYLRFFAITFPNVRLYSTRFTGDIDIDCDKLFTDLSEYLIENYPY